MERSLLLAGFVNVEMVECVDGVTSSSDGPLLKPVAIKVKKPTWQTGAATPLRRKVPGQNGASLCYCACTFHFARRPACYCPFLFLQNVALVPKFFFCDFFFLFLEPLGSMFFCLAGAVKLSFNDVTDDVFPVSKSPIKLDMGNDDDDLVDEDTLLTEEDLKAPEIPGASSSVDANGVMHAWKFSMSANR